MLGSATYGRGPRLMPRPNWCLPGLWDDGMRSRLAPFHARPGRAACPSRPAHEATVTRSTLRPSKARSGKEIDYAMLVKMYEGDSGRRAAAEQRYSPASVHWCR